MTKEISQRNSFNGFKSKKRANSLRRCSPIENQKPLEKK